MKKAVANFLFRLAKTLNPSIVIENAEEARAMGLCIHISKKDIRDFRKAHQEIKSHREGMRVLVEEARWRIAGAIARGMMEKGVIRYSTKKTLYVADVSGIAFVYGKEEDKGSSTDET